MAAGRENGGGGACRATAPGACGQAEAAGGGPRAPGRVSVQVPPGGRCGVERRPARPGRSQGC